MKKDIRPYSLSGWFFSRRTLPHWMVLLMDCLIVLFSYFLTYFLYSGRTDFHQNPWPLVWTLLTFLIIHAISFRIFRTYQGILRYSSFKDLQRVGLSMLAAAVCCLAVQYLVAPYGHFLFNFKYIITGFFSATIIMWGVRVVVKILYDQFRTERAENALIYGIGDGGVSLGKSIRSEKPAKYNLAGFIAHKGAAVPDSLLGARVYTSKSNLDKVIKTQNIKALLVPINRVDEARADETLLNTFIDAGVKVLFEQNLTDSDNLNRAKYHLQNIKIEDLLPREQIQMDLDSVSELLKGKRVLVTGSAGSIGSELTRQIASFGPSELILLDQAETPQHDIRLMMAKNFPSVKAHTIVSSIDSAHRMRILFETYRPQYVFHAAAYKHVPMMEDNPCTAVHNNIRGTRNIADLSVEFGVEKFVMVSTDKAVNPTNVMGCSKRICEIYVQSLNRAEQEGTVKGHTQFVTTRFGNVLGSNGSVIPIFKRQIEAGGPVTVTHPDIIRYFMLIPEACKLVLEAGTKGKGGEIFVFDMGKPVRIADLAKRMITLSGATGVEIKYTGLREGEKLYEELLNVQETTKPSFHEKIRIASVREYDYASVKAQVEDLIAAADTYDPMETVRHMKEIVPEYISNNSVYSVLDKK